MKAEPMRDFLNRQPVPEFMADLPPSLPNLWLCDSRTVLQVGPQGPQRLDYWGEQDNTVAVVSNENNLFMECLRPSVAVDGLNYAAEAGRQTAGLFGMYRQQAYAAVGFTIRTGIWLAEEAVIFSFDRLGDETRPAQCQLVIWPQCFKGPGQVGRQWEDWTFTPHVATRLGLERCENLAAGTSAQEAALLGVDSLKDRPAVPTCLAIAASAPLSMRTYREPLDTHCSGKFRFWADMSAGQTAFMVVAVGADEAETAERAQRLATRAPAVIAAQFARYQTFTDRLPVLQSPSPMLNRFMRFGPLSEEAVKLPTLTGCMRAKTSFYWMWLWDSALPGLIAPLYGDGKFAGELAEFFFKYAHPRKGVPFGYGRSFEQAVTEQPCDLSQPPQPRAWALQGLLEILVHDTAALNNDPDYARRMYPKVREHFKLMSISTAGDTGLLFGPSGFPDAHGLLDDVGGIGDVSTFNNGIWYNACRKMERLALLMGDAETAETARELALRFERSFFKVFWNEAEGYLATSADSRTFKQREVFSNTSAFWDFGYGDELSDGYRTRLAAYQLGHFYSPMGISIFSPKHPKQWDRDGNQFHCSWPCLDSHNLKLALWARNEEALAHFLPWLEHCLALHSVPEAIQMRIVADHPIVYDQGSFTTAAVSSWYKTVVECLLGVTFDAGGLTCGGTPATPMTLRGLHYRGARIEVTTEGRGWHIARLLLDGKPVAGSCKIAAAQLAGGRHAVTIVRDGHSPADWRVLGANGASVEVTTAGPGRLSFRLSGLGLTRVLVHAPGLRQATSAGQPVTPRASEVSNAYWLEWVLAPNQPVDIDMA